MVFEFAAADLLRGLLVDAAEHVVVERFAERVAEEQRFGLQCAPGLAPGLQVGDGVGE